MISRLTAHVFVCLFFFFLFSFVIQEPVKEVQTPEKMESTLLQDIGVEVVVDLASSYENLAASKNHTEVPYFLK